MRVDRVSASLNDDGEQQIIMVVLAFPPVLNNNRIQPKSSNTGMHIFQNVGHKLLVVLIRRNCFKTVIYFFFFGGGGGEGATGLGSVPPKNEVSFPLTVKIWLFSVKRSKPGGGGGKSAPDNQDSFELIIFSSSPDLCDAKRNWPQRGIEGKIPQLSYIYTNVNHSSNCWVVITILKGLQ